MKSATRSILTAILIATSAVACAYADIEFSEPTPTHPPPHPTLPHPAAHLIPEECRITPELLPPGFHRSYWGIVIDNPDRPATGRLDIIAVTNLKESNSPSEDTDWHNRTVRTLSPWGVQGKPGKAPAVNADTVPTGSYVKIGIRNTDDLMAHSPQDPVPAVVANQNGRFWNLELIIQEAAQLDHDAQALFEYPARCLQEARQIIAEHEPAHPGNATPYP